MGLEEPRWRLQDRATAIMSNAQLDNLNVNIWDYGLKNEHTEEPLLVATSDFIRYLTVGKDSLDAAPFTFANLEDTAANGTSSSAHSKCKDYNHTLSYKKFTQEANSMIYFHDAIQQIFRGPRRLLITR